MKFALVPHRRDFYHTFGYYLFKFLGPSIISFGVLGLVISFWYHYLIPISKVVGENLIILLAICDIILFSLYIYALIITVCGDNGRLQDSLRKNIRYKLISKETLDSLPICEKCGLPKPPRCHHCSFCNKCHLRMDHHCPAIGKCVALRNIQPFIVMLNWGIIDLTFMILQCMIPIYYSVTERVRIFCFTVIFVMFFGLIVKLKAEVIGRIKDNTTVVEMLSRTKNNPYDLGVEENLNQIFGTGKMRFLIPRKSKLTGFEWMLPEYRNDTDLLTNENYNFQNVSENI